MDAENQTLNGSFVSIVDDEVSAQHGWSPSNHRIPIVFLIACETEEEQPVRIEFLRPRA